MDYYALECEMRRRQARLRAELEWSRVARQRRKAPGDPIPHLIRRTAARLPWPLVNRGHDEVVRRPFIERGATNDRALT